MPNATVRANAEAVPTRVEADLRQDRGPSKIVRELTRRATLRYLAGAAVLTSATPVPALAFADSDAELIALATEIVRRAAEADDFQRTHIEVHNERFQTLLRPFRTCGDLQWEAAWTFSRDSGRDAAIDELGRFYAATDALFTRLMAIPATTQLGRAAKVRALLINVMGSKWRGPAEDLDYEKDMARQLLGEFAGLCAAELAAIGAREA